MLVKLFYKNTTFSREFQRDVNLFFLHYIATRSVLVYTIMVLFFLEFGLSFAAIMVLSVVESISSLVFSIPVGLLADRWNKKKVVMLGKILSIVGFLTYIIHPSFYMFLIAEILLSIGNTCISSADTSFLYSKFKQNKHEEIYKNFIAFRNSKLFIVGAFATILATIIYSINIFLPFILSSMVLILSTFFLLKIKDETESCVIPIENNKKTVKLQLKKSIESIQNNKVLRDLTILNGLFIVIIANISYVSSAYLQELGMEIVYMGVFFFLSSMVASYASKKSIFLYEKYKSKFYHTLLIFLSLSFILMSIRNLFLIAIIIILTRLMSALIMPALSATINLHIDDENRTTTLSMIGFLQSLLTVLIDPAIGLLMDITSMSTAFLYVGIVFTVMSIIYIKQLTNSTFAINKNV